MLFDDFSDGNYTNNPIWTVTAGSSWTAANFDLRANDQNVHMYIQTPSTITSAVWEWTMQMNQVANYHDQYVAFMHVNSSNSYVIYVISNGTYRLYKNVAGTWVILIDSGIARNTLQHAMKVTRDSAGNIEWFMDGISKGTVTNNEITTSNKIEVKHYGSYNSYVSTFDNFRVRKFVSPEPTFGVSGTEELNITAIDMILNTNTCASSCQIIAGVTWQNLGSSNVTFTPAILIDNITIASATSNITIEPYPATGSSTITTPTLLAGTHTICPYPN